ncbi:MAG: hypothetical protein ACK419_07300 [Pyrinomonadaceae bacterium]
MLLVNTKPQESILEKQVGKESHITRLDTVRKCLQVASAVYLIVDESKATATGFEITPGILLTNYHTFGSVNDNIVPPQVAKERASKSIIFVEFESYGTVAYTTPRTDMLWMPGPYHETKKT